MSNAEAAKLYDAIIEEVITESRQDFEDSGIDEATLQDLRKIWREKLTQSGVAVFPWNPKPDEEEVAQTTNDATFDNRISVSDQNTSAVEHGGDYQQSMINGNGNMNGNGINNIDLNNSPQAMDHSQLQYPTLQSTQQGHPDIQLQYGHGMQLPKRENDGLILPRINQVDGNIEFTITDNRIEIEIPEGFPLDKSKQKKKHKQKNKRIKQVDGADDSSDGINSDLDDSEFDSQNSDDEDGETEGMIMLCLYDKVQRVKNKWKSNLKDGIANINGKDYAFQKATGESEW